jgi:hypothetical protein
MKKPILFVIFSFIVLTTRGISAQLKPILENEIISVVSLNPEINEKGYYWNIRIKSKIEKQFYLTITEIRNNKTYDIFNSQVNLKLGENKYESEILDIKQFNWIFENTDAQLFFSLTLESESKKNSYILNIPVIIQQTELSDLRRSAALFLNIEEKIQTINIYYNFDGRRWSIVNHRNENNNIFYEFYPFPSIPEYSIELFQVFRYMYIENEKFNKAIKDKKYFFQQLISELKSSCKGFKSKILKEEKENLYFQYSVESCNGSKPASYYGRYLVGKKSTVLFIFIYFETEIPKLQKEIYQIGLEKQSNNY